MPWPWNLGPQRVRATQCDDGVAIEAIDAAAEQHIENLTAGFYDLIDGDDDPVEDVRFDDTIVDGFVIRRVDYRRADQVTQAVRRRVRETRCAAFERLRAQPIRISHSP